MDNINNESSAVKTTSPKSKKEKKSKKAKKQEEEIQNAADTVVEQTVMRQFDDQPPVQETQVFEAPKKVEPAKKKAVVSDFDELSFDGFDFDDLDSMD